MEGDQERKEDGGDRGVWVEDLLSSFWSEGSTSSSGHRPKTLPHLPTTLPSQIKRGSNIGIVELRQGTLLAQVLPPAIPPAPICISLLPNLAATM